MRHFTEYLSDDRSVRLDAFITEPSPDTPYLGTARPAVIVCPGGGYRNCCDREAEPVALKYAAAGFQAFVLRYTVGKNAVFPTSLIDLGTAIKYVRDNAESLYVLPDQIAVCGFSAGGHLTASLGVYWNDEAVLTACGAVGRELRPDLLILGYPVISTSWMENAGDYKRIAGNPDDPAIYQKLNLHTAVNGDTPPAFITHGVDDETVPVRDTLKFAAALEAHDIPFEMHVFSHGHHGYSTADETTCNERWLDPALAQWIPLSIAWLNRNFKGELGKEVNKARYSSKL